VGFAAPVTDFTKGKWQVDATIMPSLSLGIQYYDDEYNPQSQTNVGFGLTYGLGNDWAVQYKSNNFDGGYRYDDPYSNYYNHRDYSMRGQELNFLHKLDKNSAVFVGITRSKSGYDQHWGYYDGEQNTAGFNDKAVEGLQVGLQTVVPVSDKIDGYVVAAVGSKITSFEIGMAYKATKNLDVNISYLDRKYKDADVFNYSSYYGNDTSYSARGVGLGVSYRF